MLTKRHPHARRDFYIQLKTEILVSRNPYVADMPVCHLAWGWRKGSLSISCFVQHPLCGKDATRHSLGTTSRIFRYDDVKESVYVDRVCSMYPAVDFFTSSFYNICTDWWYTHRVVVMLATSAAVSILFEKIITTTSLQHKTTFINRNNEQSTSIFPSSFVNCRFNC